MAKTSNTQKPSQDDALTSRKKLAKKEAKLLLKVEQVKKDVQKAEQKIQRAQENLKNHTGRLQDLEDSLTQLRQPAHKKSGQKASHKDITQKKVQTSSDTYTGQEPDPGESYEDSEAIEELRHVSLEPAEGRVDIGENASTTLDRDLTYTTEQASQSDTTPHETTTDASIKSGAGSISLENSQPGAWPPAPIREELAETITEETTATAVTSAAPASSKAPATPRRASRRRSTHSSQNNQISPSSDQDKHENSSEA
ncbi:hypothetical protein [Dictyobacter arantiisoli]|uniref:Uncharacterized protein n=1 Tax=Dictyobacter arantiisoli TaxID=2014874 RepID=A0A5A5TEW5_9CHLR|nr:hypothetical protein [Dictyobacter arantiisoli]GCF09867.1 hypothetical protein KDI_34310 [Dictyobacter arantiisoli]